jgi:hypothetical protein
LLHWLVFSSLLNVALLCAIELKPLLLVLGRPMFLLVPSLKLLQLLLRKLMARLPESKLFPRLAHEQGFDSSTSHFRRRNRRVPPVFIPHCPKVAIDSSMPGLFILEIDGPAISTLPLHCALRTALAAGVNVCRWCRSCVKVELQCGRGGALIFQYRGDAIEGVA